VKIPQGNKLWLNRKAAEAEGVNVDSLVRYHRTKTGLELYPDSPTLHDDGTATCHGCGTRKDHNVLYWQPWNMMGDVGLYGLCRECTGHTIPIGPPSRDAERIAAFEASKPMSDPNSPWNQVNVRRQERKSGEGRRTRPKFGYKSAGRFSDD
jgi:hypothetical protein